ncbi:hypothetical protein OUZ56_018886 [Daphnia magna]|uniref:Uncharacterized protein n=1 Tax=Daphnia magna TaxID=35525 RepID=A0ABQ9ZA10_9CRUS|nr:hypothetical protein OUZ56_018886 [Daphnia magna]
MMTTKYLPLGKTTHAAIHAREKKEREKEERNSKKKEEEEEEEEEGEEENTHSQHKYPVSSALRQCPLSWVLANQTLRTRQKIEKENERSRFPSDLARTAIFAWSMPAISRSFDKNPPPSSRFQDASVYTFAVVQ